jgi:glyoxylase-like metal-dependent hydrolase (beta-lactamase superfamily II)
MRSKARLQKPHEHAMGSYGSFQNPHRTVRIQAIQAGLSVAYVLEFSNGRILVDAGSPGHERPILQAIETSDSHDLRLIFITHAHFDHYGCAAAIRRQTNAPIAVHTADSQALARGETLLGNVKSWGIIGKWLLPVAERLWPPEPTEPDRLVEDGDTFEEFGLDARVVHTPGHTPGSSSLLVNESLLFVGDVISSRPWLFAQCYYAHDWTQVAESVRRLAALDARWVFPGHGQPVRGERMKKLSLNLSVRTTH